MSSHFKNLILKNLKRPFKVDLRDPCEYNVQGPITRTFEIPRKELIELLQTSDSPETLDRIDVIEYPEEIRYTMYNSSRIDNPTVDLVRNHSSKVTEWDLDPQYGDLSARGNWNKK